MGNTLDQHRAAIGGFATRQVSPNWTHSSSSSSFFKSFESSGEDGGGTKSHVGQLAQLVLLVSIFHSGSPTAQNHNPKEMRSFETPTTIVANGYILIYQVSFDYNTEPNLKYNSGEGSPRRIGFLIIYRSKFFSR